MYEKREWFIRSGGCCHICQRQHTLDGYGRTWNWKQSKGGGDDVRSLAVVCISCNRMPRLGSRLTGILILLAGGTWGWSTVKEKAIYVKSISILAGTLALLIGGIWGCFAVMGEDNEAERLTHAVEETQKKAEALQQSFNSLSMGGPQIESNRIVPGILAAPLFPQTPSTPTPTIEPATQSIRRDRTVQEAWEQVERIESEGSAGTQEHKDAVSHLKDSWTERYENAIRDFESFEEQLSVNHQLAESYIQVQENLTDKIQNSQLREAAMNNDQEQRQWITEYQLQAGVVLLEARTIKVRLDDMTIILEKTALTVALPREIRTGVIGLPQSLSSLNSEIDLFKKQTDMILDSIREDR